MLVQTEGPQTIEAQEQWLERLDEAEAEGWVVD